jgi:UDP-N-acetylmuramoyl-tripeptide--D-alanyl-D-alanine ligase
MSSANEVLPLAREKLSALAPKVVCIAGDAERVSSMELIFAALKGTFKVHKAAVGAQPLIAACCDGILGMPDDVEILLLEFDASRPGDATEVVRNFPATHGVITDDRAVPIALELVGSKRLSGLYYNADDCKLSKIAGTSLTCRDMKATGVGFAGAGVKIYEASQCAIQSGEPCLFVELSAFGRDYRCSAKLLGRRSARNVAFAFAVALDLGVPPEEICAGISSAELPAGRGRVCRLAGGLLVDETSDATPESMSHSLKNIIELETGGAFSKLAILGGMRGLGVESLYWHEIVMSRASILDGVYLIGSEWDGVVTEQSSLRGRWDDADEFIVDFDTSILNGAVTLVKGSDYYGMGKILSHISRMKETELCR